LNKLGKAVGVIVAIIMIIIMIAVSAWVWSANEADFNEIQQLTCDQYNLSEEECKRAIEEAKGK
jgi:DNA-binding transcriptional regulator of glucitol operon